MTHKQTQRQNAKSNTVNASLVDVVGVFEVVVVAGHVSLEVLDLRQTLTEMGELIGWRSGLVAVRLVVVVVQVELLGSAFAWFLVSTFRDDSIQSTCNLKLTTTTTKTTK